MRYQTPQFIDVEDKIFGPLTLWQFIYLAGGAGLAFTAWQLSPVKILSLPIVIPIVVLTLALAFYKINNKPFVHVMEAAVLFFKNSRLYVWRKIPKKRIQKEKQQETATDPLMHVPKLSDSKLKELAWSLDIHDTTAQKIHERERAQRT